MDIRQKLNKFSETHKLSGIASAAGLNRVTLSRYVNGHCLPSPSSIERLAKALHVDSNWLADDAAGWPPLWSNDSHATTRRQRRRTAAGSV